MSYSLVSVLLTAFGEQVLGIIGKHIDPKHRKKFIKFALEPTKLFMIVEDKDGDSVIFEDGKFDDSYDSSPEFLLQATKISILISYGYSKEFFHSKFIKGCFKNWDTPFEYGYEKWKNDVITDLENKFGDNFTSIKIKNYPNDSENQNGNNVKIKMFYFVMEKTYSNDDDDDN